MTKWEVGELLPNCRDKQTLYSPHRSWTSFRYNFPAYIGATVPILASAHVYRRDSHRLGTGTTAVRSKSQQGNNLPQSIWLVTVSETQVSSSAKRRWNSLRFSKQYTVKPFNHWDNASALLLGKETGPNQEATSSPGSEQHRFQPSWPEGCSVGLPGIRMILRVKKGLEIRRC